MNKFVFSILFVFSSDAFANLNEAFPTGNAKPSPSLYNQALEARAKETLEEIFRIFENANLPEEYNYARAAAEEVIMVSGLSKKQLRKAAIAMDFFSASDFEELTQRIQLTMNDKEFGQFSSTCMKIAIGVTIVMCILM